MAADDKQESAGSDTASVESPADLGKLTRDIAKAANETVDTVEKVVRFVDGLFGHGISNALGMVGDKLAYFRLKRAIILHEKLEENLKKKGVTRRYVPVAFGLPIIEKASVEEDAALGEKWANLLTNFVDSTYDKPLRRNYASILGDMEPVDATVLDSLIKEYLGLKPEERRRALFEKDALAKELKLGEEVCENALRNLIRLGVLKPGVVSGEDAMIGEYEISSYQDTEMVGVTLLGVDFYHAVNLSDEK